MLLAVSGGADSLALLHGAASLASEYRWRLSVAHVHHGWRGREADRDLAFVKDHARRLALPFFWKHRDARAEARRHRVSPEAGARLARYGALLEMSREAGAARIATAHHAGDALECFLLARERRAGISGLGGPRELRKDGVVRPLLGLPRAEILSFLRSRGVSWRRDGSNGDLRLARNRIRREILAAPAPLIQSWEDEAGHWRRVRDELDRQFLERIAPAMRHGPDSMAVDAALLQGCAPDLQRRALESAAAPFSRPGRPPMTGREREDVRWLLSTGRDFRFEAGRRIAIRRRGAVLSFALRPGLEGCTI